MYETRPLPKDDFTICDPAVGTGGFLMSSYEWLMDQTGGALKRENAVRIRIVPTTELSWCHAHAAYAS